jgi:predicted dehydrogenase
VLRIAVIGVGAWGRNHVRAVTHESQCQLVGVADPDPRARAQVEGRAPAVRTTPDPDELLTSPSVDAVIIASPALTHAALVEAALRAGKHVLVEKPLALDLATAERLAELASSSGRIGMVGHLMVHHPAVLRLRELLQSGTLGSLHYLHSTRVNLGRLRQDENALWSFGPHDVSMMNLLVGKMPASVTARGQCVLQRGVEDVVFLTLRYASGEMAHVHMSWLSPRKERRLTVVCSRKMAEFDDVAADKLRIYDKGFDKPPPFQEYAEYLTLRDGDVYIPTLPMQEPLQLQLQHFLTAVASGTPSPVADFVSGARVIAVLAAAQKSLEADGVPMPVRAA